MSTLPSSVAHLCMPIISWLEVMLFGSSSLLLSNSATKAMFMGVPALLGIDHLSSCEVDVPVVLTAALTHPSLEMAQQLIPLIGLFCSLAPGCISGGSILLFLNLTVPPFNPSSASLGLSPMVRMSSMQHKTQSQILNHLVQWLDGAKRQDLQLMRQNSFHLISQP